jgi:hypothetical protein
MLLKGLDQATSFARNILEMAKERKRQKYEGIELMANRMLTDNIQDLKKMYINEKVEEITRFVIVSSLGVVPKDTYKTIRRICKVCDRDSSQAANIMAKRMSIATIKRSQEIYSNTFKDSPECNDVIDPEISPEDTNEEIKDKQFDSMQKEISSQEELVVGERFNYEEATDENEKAYRKTERDRLKERKRIADSVNKRRIMIEEENICTDTDTDMEPYLENEEQEISIL